VLTRVLGTLVALAAHLLLALTVWYLYPFLAGGTEPAAGISDPDWWWYDLLLVAQFALPHSLLLHPSVRDRLERVIPGPLYGCFFTAATCASLLLLILCWRTSPVVIYHLEGWADSAIRTAYVLCWVALLYSLKLTGYGYQTGWTPFWGWLRDGRPPRRTFEVRGAYHWLRHPVYLSFLGQIWCTPLMTLDRALFTLAMTGYIFLGSWFKDRRLRYYLGTTYEQYQARVPGYPLAFGPLGRVPLRRREESVSHG
jgi:protein-S-isoprenylcysteine O-methyltransferase Ste14